MHPLAQLLFPYSFWQSSGQMPQAKAGSYQLWWKKLSLEFLALQINMKSLQCGSIIESTDLISGVAKVNFSPSCIHNELVIIVREHCSSECFQIWKHQILFRLTPVFSRLFLAADETKGILTNKLFKQKGQYCLILMEFRIAWCLECKWHITSFGQCLFRAPTSYAQYPTFSLH